MKQNSNCKKRREFHNNLTCVFEMIIKRDHLQVLPLIALCSIHHNNSACTLSKTAFLNDRDYKFNCEMVEIFQRNVVAYSLN